SGSHLSPFKSQPLSPGFRHWLGTDVLGRDVLAGIIRGCRVSLFIGIGSMLIALLIGIPLGSFAAYYGNRYWKISWIELLVLFAIALLRWPVMARYIRAEIYKMKESNYIRSVQLLNIPDLRILSKHLVPYAFRPVMISFIFGIASAILAESSLSFLGIGLPAE